MVLSIILSVRVTVANKRGKGCGWYWVMGIQKKQVNTKIRTADRGRDCE